MARQIWLHYLMSSGGSAVERVLIIAFIAGLLVVAIESTELRNLEKLLWENLFNNTNKRATF